MKIEPFVLERTQSIWENTVEFNLTETGVHPFTLNELMEAEELRELMDIRIGYGQTNGSIELREAISNLYPGTDRENILVTSGSIEANFITIWNLLEPHDELVLMLPNYMQIWGLARSFQVYVKPFYLKENLNWQPDLDELKKLITAKTKMIAVCNPNNPTGAVLSKEAEETIISLAKEANAWLYADEIYRGAELSGRETPSFYGRYDKVIVAGGLSKAYALPGLRIGWLTGPHREIGEIWARRDYTTIATAVLSNRIAALALKPEKRTQILRRNRSILQDNIAVLNQWTKSHPGLFKYIPPQAGGMVFMHYDMDINSTDLAERIRKEKSTFIVAGDCFGMDRYVRIGIGSETAYFENGLCRISEILEQIR